ncbi:CaiB/BaiF CoA transferase family protein [Thalassobacillus devorans]|uniref:CaiB/BaiF CoA transferase family protein n=1 Tax=Thalassobacillus devorans TaxID=279813 RepID=UPI000A1CD505|nr:CaiB/BaiF CoA-transferase family protein [Thalassobacillus devorans]
MTKALGNIRILDLTRVLAGPYCTMILGDLGAEVIKVEAPRGSDETREWGPPYANDVSAYYLCANRNKRAVTINLKSERGRKILKDLVKKSDVVIDNFKHTTMKKWGLDYENLKELNPQIISCSITGFGQNGPYNHLPGYDFIIQALSGLMSITGTKESGPVKVGVAISDILTGLYSAIGILAAINERNQSNKGQSIDISLFDSQVSALANVASNYLVSENIPQLLGNQHPNIVPYQVFSTLDGEIVIAVGNDGQFSRLCSLLGLEQLTNHPKFSSNSLRLQNREKLIDLISNKIKEKSTKEWNELLQDNGIPCGPINNIKDVFEDPQVKAREMALEVEHPTAGSVKLVGSPLKLSRTPVDYKRHPPLPGEHTEEVLTDMGYTLEDIEDLKGKNII